MAADVRPGDQVVLHSLASRADLNHRSATLVEWVDGRWNAVLCDGSGVRLKPSNLAAVVAESFAVVPLRGRGMGCVAARDIDRGERLVAEAPLTVEGPGHPPLDESVAALSEADRERFFALAQDEALFGVGAAKTIDGIVGTNGMPFYSEQGELYGGVFPVIARFNHSCDANCGERWNGALRQRTVHAIRHIRAGSECTICYGFGGTTFAPRAARCRHLREQFGFECTCAKCSLLGEALAASDARAVAIGTDEMLLSRLLACGRADALRAASPEPASPLLALQRTLRPSSSSALHAGGAAATRMGIATHAVATPSELVVFEAPQLSNCFDRRRPQHRQAAIGAEVDAGNLEVPPCVVAA